MKRVNSILNDTDKLCLTAFIISLIIHLIFFVIFAVNGAILLDESLTLLNGRFLADFKTDCFGEKMPIYFDNWLFGGQSPFATYLVALMIKIFGYNLFITRIPIFLISEVGLIALHSFLKEAFKKDKYVKTIFILACFSPWHIFNSIYTLDCNFMPHILMIALAFLVKAINSEKAKYYIVSMIFFALCFYCYIAATLIITFILVITYICLLKSERISLKNTLISIITIVIIALPFIISGLVQLDIIHEIKLFGISISKMPYYNRSETIVFTKCLKRLIKGIIYTVFPDLLLIRSIGMMNGFAYTNFIGGISFVSGIIFLTYTYVKKTNKDLTLIRIFSLAFIITYLINISTTFVYTAMYRYYSFNYIFIIIEGIGFIYLSGFIKRYDFKKIFSLFIFISVLMSCTNYFLMFDKNTLNNNYWYINSFKDSVEYAKELGYERIAICFDNNDETLSPWSRNAVALRLCDYDNIESYYSLKDELLMFLDEEKREIPLTKDNHFYYKEVKDKDILYDDCLIMTSDDLRIININTDLYETKGFGETVVIYKK